MLDILALGQQNDHVFEGLCWLSIENESLRFLDDQFHFLGAVLPLRLNDLCLIVIH